MDEKTFSALALIALVAVIAPLLSEAIRSRIPSVVIEIALGIVIGPYTLALAKITPVVDALSVAGLTFLFFMAGYEIDMRRIRGRPLRLATLGWVGSLACALVIAAVLYLVGFTLSELLIALALTTTALGTLLPMLEDNHEMRLGLDVLLGAFAAGLVVRLANQGEDAHVIELKLSGLAFGLFVPVFFIVSGMQLDLDALTQDIGTMLCVPLFLALFLVVRGIPTLWSHRRELVGRDRIAAALFASTALPIIVAITQIGLARGDMKPENAAALVAAGILSVLLFPAIAFALRRGHSVVASEHDGARAT